MKTFALSLFLCWSIFLFAQEDFTLNIHEIGDPDGLNPVTSTAANALYMQDNVFCKLLGYNQQTLAIEPVLALNMPTVEVVEKGKYKGYIAVSYEIHPKATWDNGTTVTGEDYLFTLKAIRNPKVNSSQIRPYFDFIEDIIIDSKNKKKFTLYIKEPYFRMIESSGCETHILPKYHYDSKGLMDKFSFKDLGNEDKLESLVKNPQIIQFAKEFNDPSFARESEKVIGCGPYRFVEWNIGRSVAFERKKDWWGDEILDREALKAYPSRIVYKVLPDMTTAFSDAKNGKLDIIRSVHPTVFIDLQENKDFNSKFNFETPSQFAYHYLGFNTKRPQLSELAVRKAIALAVDRKAIIESVFEGYASTTNTPVSPGKSFYNNNIKEVPFDLEQAKELLDKAGWKDTDGDGILDKIVDGEKCSLQLKFSYNQGNMVRRNIGQLLKENLSQLKVQLDLAPVSFPEVLELVDARDVDIYALAWVKPTGLDDLFHVWHRDADKPGGSNRVGFGTEETDEILEELRRTMNPEKQKELYFDIQEKIAAAHCYVFLVVPNELILVRNSFDYPKLSPMRPGYATKLFQLKK